MSQFIGSAPTAFRQSKPLLPPIRGAMIVGWLSIIGLQLNPAFALADSQVTDPSYGFCESASFTLVIVSLRRAPRPHDPRIDTLYEKLSSTGIATKYGLNYNEMLPELLAGDVFVRSRLGESSNWRKVSDEAIKGVVDELMESCAKFADEDSESE